MDETRIPLEEFEDFDTARLVGTQFGIRYEAFCEAVAQFQRIAPEPRQCTIARCGREPRVYTDLEQTFGEPAFTPSPWGGRIG